MNQAIRKESGNVARAAARVGESEHYVRARRGQVPEAVAPSVVVVGAQLARMEGRLTLKLRTLERAMFLEAARQAENICAVARKLGGSKYRRQVYRMLPPDKLETLRRSAPLVNEQTAQLTGRRRRTNAAPRGE